MIRGSFWERLVRGTGWTWLDERHRAALPADLAETVMTLESRDRFHAKQGRSTARVVFHSAAGPLPVYLKRHYRLPWRSRLAALIDPARPPHARRRPSGRTWSGVRALGIAVPEVVAVGERIGPWGALQSFLMVAELTGCLPLHEALPALAGTLDRPAFAAFKRALIAEMAAITATLHRPRPVPQGSLPLPLLPRHGAAEPGRPEALPDRPAPAGGASPLARPLAVEGPGAAPVLDPRRRRDRRATACGSGSITGSGSAFAGPAGTCG